MCSVTFWIVLVEKNANQILVDVHCDIVGQAAYYSGNANLFERMESTDLVPSGLHTRFSQPFNKFRRSYMHRQDKSPLILGALGCQKCFMFHGVNRVILPIPSFRPGALDPRFALDGHFHADPHPGNLLVEKGTDRRPHLEGWCWHRVDWKRPKRWGPKIIEP